MEQDRCSPNPSGHTHTHDAIQPTKHVFGLREETGVPGGNSKAQGEHRTSIIAGWRWDRTLPNPGGMRPQNNHDN